MAAVSPDLKTYQCMVKQAENFRWHKAATVDSLTKERKSLIELERSQETDLESTRARIREVDRKLDVEKSDLEAMDRWQDSHRARPTPPAQLPSPIQSPPEPARSGRVTPIAPNEQPTPVDARHLERSLVPELHEDVSGESRVNDKPSDDPADPPEQQPRLPSSPPGAAAPDADESSEEEMHPPFRSATSHNKGKRKRARRSFVSQSRVKVTRAMTFDEVYQNGRAERKYRILQWPRAADGDWFIMQCPQHPDMEFGAFNLRGVTKHLEGRAHGLGDVDAAAVYKTVGVQVLGCDQAKADMNNALLPVGVAHRIEAGDDLERPKQPSTPSTIKTVNAGSKPQQGPHPHASSAKPSSSRQSQHNRTIPDYYRAIDDNFPSIIQPTLGAIYKTVWFRDNTWYPVVPLPTDRFDTIGLIGKIQDTALVNAVEIPDCYTYDVDSRTTKITITGWMPGYEDGGSDVHDRWFPCFFLDPLLKIPIETPQFRVKEDLLSQRVRVFAWVKARDLREASRDFIDSHENALAWEIRQKAHVFPPSPVARDKGKGKEVARDIEVIDLTMDEEDGNPFAFDK